jgi:hypothetical protein
VITARRPLGRSPFIAVARWCGRMARMPRPFQFRLRTIFVIIAFVATFFGGMLFERKLEARRKRVEDERMYLPGPAVVDDVPQGQAQEEIDLTGVSKEPDTHRPYTPRQQRRGASGSPDSL